MRLSVSNIAWSCGEDEKVLAILRKYKVDAIDVAPATYFADLGNVTDRGIRATREWWNDNGIEIYGMQGLTFGTSFLNMFGPTRQVMMDHLENCCHVGAELGVSVLTFGSPRSRDRSGLSDLETMDEAGEFFSELGDVADAYGVTVCLEPNPLCYDCNFMTNTAETAAIVRIVNHPSISMQLDTGAMTINNESVEEVVRICQDIIGHVHASERSLLVLGTSDARHVATARALTKYYREDLVVTVEMRATTEGRHLLNLDDALKFAVENYRGCTE